MDPVNTTAGPRVPTQQAIDILNQNAAAASKRSNYATLVQAQDRVGRDQLRRDNVRRTPTGEYPGYLDVPADQSPVQTPLPTSTIGNLVDQFRGQGAGAGGGGGGLARGSGGGGSPDTPVPSGGGGGPITGPVDTATNEGRPANVGPRAVIRFERTGEQRGGSAVWRAIMGPADRADLPYNYFVGAMVNVGVSVPNVSRSNIDLIYGG